MSFSVCLTKIRRKRPSLLKQKIEEYLDLYIKFKLKVAEAYDRRMDTIPDFIAELEGYRKQLAQPYLTDKNVTDLLVNEAYMRSLEEVNASHLLVSCSQSAKPLDTMKAYSKIMEYRRRIMEDGEDFEELAASYSDDPSAKINKGSLGYFTSFQMIYPFENAAYRTKVGEVSMPVRTQYGYHLVYVKDRRDALGEIKVAHIMVKYYNDTQIDSTKKRIEAVLEKLKNGADWEQMVNEFSDDFNTNSKGGQLNWFNRTSSGIPEEFKDVAYTLKKDGDISEPIQTKYGWHIIKRIEIKPRASYEDSKSMLRRKVERDSRSELNKNVVLKRIKEENNYTPLGGLESVASRFGDELVEGNYKRPTASGTALFEIAGNKYTDAGFLRLPGTQCRNNRYD